MKIKAAPRDEMVLLLHETGRVKSGLFDSYLGYWNWTYAKDPTHWQPLPPAPIAKARGDL